MYLEPEMEVLEMKAVAFLEGSDPLGGDGTGDAGEAGEGGAGGSGDFGWG